jgi:Fic family protein
LVDSPGEIQVKKSTICTLHNLLSDGLVSPQYAGQVRDYGVRISGTGYVPLENPQYLEIFLNEICQKAALIKKPFEQSIFLLAHIAYLQAFVDVNKRTSRLSANIPLINHNLVPLSFNDVTQEDYTSAMLAVYEMNDIRPLIDVYVHSYLRTSTAYDATIGAINFDPVRVRYRQQRRQIIRHIVSNVYDAKKTKSYIASVVPELVKQEDIMQVLKNIEDDLAQLGPQSMAGLGISSAQLMLWRDKNKK